MKVRRRTSSGLGALLSRLDPRVWIQSLRRGNGAGDDWLARVERASDTSSSTPPAAGSTAPAGPAPSLVRWPTWARPIIANMRSYPVPWILGASFTGSAVAGYLFAALVMFPAPFFTATRAVPSVLGLGIDEAREALESRGFTVPEADAEPHPFAAAGQVIWQEPPPETMVPEVTTVRLTISNGPQRIPVPDVAGFERDLARRLIEAAGLAVGGVEAVQTAVPQGVTVNTRPVAGSTLLPGGEVTLVVSIGAPTISVPDLAGMLTEDAQGLLEDMGLTLGDTFRRTSSAHPEGTVVDQRPAAGTLLAEGSEVSIWIARSP